MVFIRGRIMNASKPVLNQFKVYLIEEIRAKINHLSNSGQSKKSIAETIGCDAGILSRLTKEKCLQFSVDYLLIVCKKVDIPVSAKTSDKDEFLL